MTEYVLKVPPKVPSKRKVTRLLAAYFEIPKRYRPLICKVLSDELSYKSLLDHHTYDELPMTSNYSGVAKGVAKFA